jgi:3-dehydroquinate dehydratase / shikimate dehydrogenase
MLCLSLTGATLAENAAVLERWRDSIDLAELRADFLRPDELAHLNRFPAMARLPVILTLRRGSDQGHFHGPEADRLALLAGAAGAGFTFVDLEHDAASEHAEAAARSAGARIIRSYHDFTRVPGDVARLIRELPHAPDELPKVAVMPGGSRDLLRFVAALDETTGVEKIALAMGTVGFPTRVLARRLGSLLTYTSETGASAAPGHTDPGTLAGLYRYPEISRRAAVYAVIGNPVMHSQSPHIHNPALRRLGMDAVYVPFHVDDLPAFLELARRLPIDGVSVTVPLKERILPLLQAVDERVTAIGACNTVVRDADAFLGTNTDAVGFLAPLLHLFGRRRLAHMGATVIGAGGAARAVVYALRSVGARVLVLNRTVERARRLAGEFGAGAAGLDEVGVREMAGHNDVVVQTTSVGMHPHEDGDPLPSYRFSGAEVVYEIVYNPPATPLVRRALAAGCTVIGGKRMLLEQAYEQFRLFTKVDYPR